MIRSFPPLISKKTKILILGSIPGVESLEKQQYYGNSRNAFWFIMSKICSFDSTLCYEKRCRKILEEGIALWDVLKHCERQGSLDSSIKNDSIGVNEIGDLFSQYPSIQKIFFNGMKAESEYKKRVTPILSPLQKEIPQERLPSTSPAMAMLSREKKSVLWCDAIMPWL